jgi:hypothetical protein
VAEEGADLGETLQLLPGSFVDEDLKQVHSDVLHRVALRGGAELWLYMLFEHQRTVDPLMAWRLLRYMVRIWDRVLGERGGRELPFVVPMVLYKGERRWTVSEAFDALFPSEDRVGRLREALLPHVPRFRYVLQDLSTIPDEALRGLALRECVLLAFKHAPDGTVWFRRWLLLLLQVAVVDGLHALEAVWRYVMTVAPAPPPEEVRGFLVARLPPEGQRLIMGYGEQLIEQGRQEGRQEGREEGRQEGLLLGEARVLLKQMRLKFGVVPGEVVARVERATEAELEAWTARILTADTLEAVLG